MNGPIQSSDLQRVKKCKECGSMNVSMDIGTGKSVCRDCGGDDVKKFNYAEYANKEAEKQVQDLQKQTIVGGKVINIPDEEVKP